MKTVIPVIKATLAKELVKTYGLTQNEVAEILGISQSAVSKYTRQVRGYTIRIQHMEDVQPLISRMVTLLGNENPKRSNFLRLFCQTCITIRKKGIMCRFCKKTEPKTKEECNLCLNISSA